MQQAKLTGILLAALAITGTTSAHEAGHQHHPGMDMTGHWMAPAKAAKKRNPVPATPASQARGESLYQSHCAACHGAQGEGDGPAGTGLEPQPANLQSMATHHSDGDLAWKIAHGRGAMPAWKGILNSTQIWDLVNHIRRLAGQG